MLWFLVIACTPTADTPDAPPAQPVAAPEAKPETHWPELPPVSSRGELPEPDPRVVGIFEGAEDFQPDQFMQAMNATQAIGADALPSLLALIDRTNDGSRLFSLCEAVERLEVRDARIAPWLAPKMLHPEDVGSGSCTAALAGGIPVGGEDVGFLAAVYEDVHTPTPIRLRIAQSVRQPSWCSRWKKSVLSAAPSEVANGVWGLSRCDGVGSLLLAVAGDESADRRTRDDALFVLQSQPPLPSGRPIYRARLDDPSLDHGLTAAIELLAEVGVAADRPAIQRVIDTDAHGGAGVHAVAARKTLKRLTERGER